MSTTWRVFKKLDVGDPSFGAPVGWDEWPPLESGYETIPPGASVLGEAYGAGEYLLIQDDTDARGWGYIRRVVIAERTMYCEADASHR